MIVIVVVIVFFSMPLYAQQDMTVEDAIRVGLKNNYDIHIARNNAEIAANDKGRGTAGFLPVIDTSNGLRYNSTNPETGSPFSFSESVTRNVGAQISLNWTLFDGFAMFIDRRRFNELAKLGDYQARDIIESTVVAIMREFFNVVQQEQLLDVAQNTRDVSETRYNREQVRRDLGGASSTDLLNAEVNFNNDQTVLLNQELQVVIARKDLNLLLAEDPDEPLRVKKEIAVPELGLDFDELLALALQRNSELMVVRQNKIVADENVKLARSVFFPTLLLSGTYGYNDRELFGPGGFGGSFGGTSLSSGNRKTHTIDASIGLLLSFNVFNGNLDRINYQNARLNAKSQALALKDTENRLAGLLREKCVTFQKRIETVRIEEQNVVAAAQNLKLQQDRYRTGAADSLDFRDAQVNLARAQATLIVARFQARITLLEIQQLIGSVAIE
jgi:outer membrane protein TolC